MRGKIIIPFFAVVFVFLLCGISHSQYYGNNYYYGNGYYPGYGGYARYNNYVTPGMALRAQVGAMANNGSIRLYNQLYQNTHQDGIMQLPMPMLGFYGYFIGHIEYGYPHKYGTLYYYSIEDGWVTYKGGFNYGLPHGAVEVYSSKKGYLKGIFDEGILVQRLDISRSEMVDSVRESVRESVKYSPTDKNTMTLKDMDVEVTEISSEEEAKFGRQMFRRK